MTSGHVSSPVEGTAGDEWHEVYHIFNSGTGKTLYIRKLSGGKSLGFSRMKAKKKKIPESDFFALGEGSLLWFFSESLRWKCGGISPLLLRDKVEPSKCFIDVVCESLGEKTAWSEEYQFML